MPSLRHPANRPIVPPFYPFNALYGAAALLASVSRYHWSFDAVLDRPRRN